MNWKEFIVGSFTKQAVESEGLSSGGGNRYRRVGLMVWLTPHLPCSQQAPR